MNIKILYEDDYLLAIDKPFGLVVNRAETQKNETLQDWLENNSHVDINTDDADFNSRSGVVHRLDKDTSGILLVAKTSKALKELQIEFKERTVKKEYTVLVYGIIKDLQINETIEINAPIARNPVSRTKFAIVDTGRPSITIVRLDKIIQSENYPEGFSLVTCFPKTGRTHQIRVHLTAFGHPVVGDSLYSGKNRIRRDSKVFTRQFLHASKIEFNHPITKERISIKSDLSEDLKTVLDLIG